MKTGYQAFLNATHEEYNNQPKFIKKKIKLLESLDERLTNYSNKTGYSKSRIINNLLTQRLNKIDKGIGQCYLDQPLEKFRSIR